MHTRTHPMPTPDRVAAWAAVALHAGIAVFPLPASGLLAPGWFLAVVAVLWLGGAVLVWRLAHTSPRWAWTVPVGLLAVWFVALTLGERLLGWTA